MQKNSLSLSAVINDYVILKLNPVLACIMDKGWRYSRSPEFAGLPPGVLDNSSVVKKSLFCSLNPKQAPKHASRTLNSFHTQLNTLLFQRVYTYIVQFCNALSCFSKLKLNCMKNYISPRKKPFN